MNYQLETEGYYIMRNVLSESEIKHGLSCINKEGTQVIYSEIQTFIKGNMLNKVQNLLQWPLIDYVKYRVSDNNNSVDASGFHRDIAYQGNDKFFVPPVYTCLTYFDRTVMELIPQSHKRQHYDLSDLYDLYNTKLNLEIQPGDILIFHSSMLHRGIFTQKLPHRRVIQVFEVFNSEKTLQEMIPRIMHVKGDEKYGSFMIQASKGVGPLISMINTWAYINAAQGYGAKYQTFKVCGIKGFDYFSSEGLCHRLDVEPNTWQAINKYIINKAVPVHDLPDECYKVYRFNVYNRTCATLVLQFLIAIVALIIVIRLATYGGRVKRK